MTMKITVCCSFIGNHYIENVLKTHVGLYTALPEITTCVADLCTYGKMIK